LQTKHCLEFQQKMSNHLKNAEVLGVAKNNLANLFKTRGLSEETVTNLYSDKFDPFFPSQGIIDRFAEISRTTGQPNPFIEAQGILRSMEQDFNRQNLDSSICAKYYKIIYLLFQKTYSTFKYTYAKCFYFNTSSSTICWITKWIDTY
jgi:hypothetical protein